MVHGAAGYEATSHLADSFRRAFLGCLAVALATALCYRLHANFAITSFLLLLVVMLQSLTGDFRAAILVSVAAVACLDFFFTDPLYTFIVARQMDVVALLSFLAIALVITELVGH